MSPFDAIYKHCALIMCISRDVMEAQDAVNFVRKRLGKKIDLQQISSEIVQAALDRGSVDNVTAIIVAFHVNNSPTPDKHI